MFVEFIKPETVYKNWGTETIYHNGDYCYKVLHYNKAGKKSSFHKHNIKDEVLVCTKGQFAFYYHDENGNKVSRHLNIGDGVRLVPGVYHQFEPLEDHSELTESSTHHSDLDVERLEPSDY